MLSLPATASSCMAVAIITVNPATAAVKTTQSTVTAPRSSRMYNFINRNISSTPQSRKLEAKSHALPGVAPIVT